MNVPIDDSKISEVLSRFIESTLIGNNELREQVRSVVSKMDFRDMIREHAAKAAENLVRDIVTEELRKRIKAEVKLQTKEGTLL